MIHIPTVASGENFPTGHIILPTNGRQNQQQSLELLIWPNEIECQDIKKAALSSWKIAMSKDL